MWTFQPVEPIGAEQDEVNQQRQDKQKDTQRDEYAPGIEQKPNTPHVQYSSGQMLDRMADQPVGIVQERITIRAGQPGSPLPRKEMRDDGDDCEDDEARQEYTVELFRLRLR
jgi:hypothetical protein